MILMKPGVYVQSVNVMFKYDPHKWVFTEQPLGGWYTYLPQREEFNDVYTWLNDTFGEQGHSWIEDSGNLWIRDRKDVDWFLLRWDGMI